MPGIVAAPPRPVAPAPLTDLTWLAEPPCTADPRWAACPFTLTTPPRPNEPAWLPVPLMLAVPPCWPPGAAGACAAGACWAAACDGAVGDGAVGCASGAL